VGKTDAPDSADENIGERGEPQPELGGADCCRKVRSANRSPWQICATMRATSSTEPALASNVPRSECFNPIEMAISKLKSALRKLAERAVAGLIAILEGCAGLFKPAECKSYFEACGYDPAELPALDTT
jgi:hypothetical protein